MSLKVGFIGAGGVNFGSPEGPWNHAKRLERIGGVKVVGIADPDVARAQKIIDGKLETQYKDMYQDAKVRSTFTELLDLDKPDLVFIGLPPEFHGVSTPPFNVECVCAERGVHMFIEKPIGAAPPDQILETIKILREAEKKGVYSSVGYMFRYSKAMDKMKEILKEEAAKRGDKENHISMILAKFNCAYSYINKVTWWDVRRSGGPIVEQCTHVVDLARYLAESDYDESTLRAYAIQHDQRLGKLTDMPVPYGSDNKSETVDDKVPAEFRIPRLTTAQWSFKSGALCSLTHGVMLHGANIEAEVEVWADGLRMTLEDPYTTCKLTVRRSHDGEKSGDKIETFSFGSYDDEDLTNDPYHNEVVTFLDAIKNKDPSKIRSSFEDAWRTYELTWAIRRASEKK